MRDMMVMWLYNHAIKRSHKWFDTLPRHLLGSFIKADEALIKTTYANEKWYEIRADMLKVWLVKHYRLWHDVNTKVMRDLDKAATGYTATYYSFANIEVDAWRWFLSENRLSPERYIGDVAHVSSDNKHYVDEFMRLVHILEHPQYLPYWEAGFVDDDVIRSLIAREIDPNLAAHLLA